MDWFDSNLLLAFFMKVTMILVLSLLSAFSQACSCLGRNDISETYKKVEVSVLVKYLGAVYPEVDSELLKLEEEVGLTPSSSFPLFLKFMVIDELKGNVDQSEFKIGTVSFCSHIGTINESLVTGETYIFMLNKFPGGELAVPGCSEYFVRVIHDYVYRFKYENGEFYEYPFASFAEFLVYLKSEK